MKTLLWAVAIVAVSCAVVPARTAKMAAAGCSGANLGKTEAAIEAMGDSEGKFTAQ
jgi:hypothetical protein